MSLWKRTGIQVLRVSVIYLTIKYVPYGILIVLGSKIGQVVVKNHVSAHRKKQAA